MATCCLSQSEGASPRSYCERLSPPSGSLCRQQRTVGAPCGRIGRLHQESISTHHMSHSTRRCASQTRGPRPGCNQNGCVRGSTHLLVWLQERELKLLRKDQSFEGTIPLRSHVEAERSLVNSGALGKQDSLPGRPRLPLCSSALAAGIGRARGHACMRVGCIVRKWVTGGAGSSGGAAQAEVVGPVERGAYQELSGTVSSNQSLDCPRAELSMPSRLSGLLLFCLRG